MYVADILANSLNFTRFEPEKREYAFKAPDILSAFIYALSSIHIYFSSPYFCPLPPSIYSMAKPALKASKEFIAAKDYKNAVLSAKKVLELDPLNYHAYIFLGIGHFNLAEFDECEKAYKKALEVDKESFLAWKERIYAVGRLLLSVFRGLRACMRLKTAWMSTYTRLSGWHIFS